MNKLIVSSPYFENNGLIPIDYTGYGSDNLPELILKEICKDAVSITIIMNDMSHPIPEYNHWLIWNIPVMSVIPRSIDKFQLKPSVLSVALIELEY